MSNLIRGIDWDKEVNFTPLHKAVDEEDFNKIDELLKEGADINEQMISGEAPLHHAVYRGDYKDIKYLIDHGAKPDLLDKGNNTPLRLAIRYRNFEAFKCLVDNYKDINTYNTEKPIYESPIHEAAHMGLKWVKYLVDHGADINIPNMAGETIFDIAKKENYKDILEYLNNLKK